MTPIDSPDLPQDLQQALAKIALLEQHIDEQSRQYQQLQQHYEQQIDKQRQQYEAKLARINQALIEEIAKQQRLIHRLFGKKSEGLTPKQTGVSTEFGENSTLSILYLI